MSAPLKQPEQRPEDAEEPAPPTSRDVGPIEARRRISCRSAERRCPPTSRDVGPIEATNAFAVPLIGKSALRHREMSAPLKRDGSRGEAVVTPGPSDIERCRPH